MWDWGTVLVDGMLVGRLDEGEGVSSTLCCWGREPRVGPPESILQNITKIVRFSGATWKRGYISKVKKVVTQKYNKFTDSLFWLSSLGLEQTNSISYNFIQSFINLQSKPILVMQAFLLINFAYMKIQSLVTLIEFIPLT